jgi:hypothetical protein
MNIHNGRRLSTMDDIHGRRPAHVRKCRLPLQRRSSRTARPVIIVRAAVVSRGRPHAIAGGGRPRRHDGLTVQDGLHSRLAHFAQTPHVARIEHVGVRSPKGQLSCWPPARTLHRWPPPLVTSDETTPASTPWTDASIARHHHEEALQKVHGRSPSWLPVVEGDRALGVQCEPDSIAREQRQAGGPRHLPTIHERAVRCRQGLEEGTPVGLDPDDGVPPGHVWGRRGTAARAGRAAPARSDRPGQLHLAVAELDVQRGRRQCPSAFRIQSLRGGGVRRRLLAPPADHCRPQLPFRSTAVLHIDQAPQRATPGLSAR